MWLGLDPSISAEALPEESHKDLDESRGTCKIHLQSQLTEVALGVLLTDWHSLLFKESVSVGKISWHKQSQSRSWLNSLINLKILDFLYEPSSLMSTCNGTKQKTRIIARITLEEVLIPHSGAIFGLTRSKSQILLDRKILAKLLFNQEKSIVPDALGGVILPSSSYKNIHH